ncbi:FMN-linked oxidoreductase [Auricularia subglabra TFB-10046 SS5]|nr:FMN-linked oxidoreductase [Auricularia subglabra TFB-10046 SS5]
MAPMTRMRNTEDYVPTDLMVEYYRQRSSVPGTLIITEGCVIDLAAGGYPNVPGLWRHEQVAAWKKVVDAVHANESHIFLQLWAGGRISSPQILERDGVRSGVVSSGNIALDEKHVQPRPLSRKELAEYASWFVRAAKLAVDEADFDGVEVHGANGYLVDQFIQDNTNNRTDEYGGSIENRSRFPLEVLAALVGAVGQSRVAIRLSPWDRFQHMRMADPVPQFSHLVSCIAARWPAFAYIHVAEARGARTPEGQYLPADESLEFLHKTWGPRPFISCGGYTPETALEAAQAAEANGENLWIAFARHFLANPDLPTRIQKRLPLNAYDRPTFYTPRSPKGYVDYPYASADMQGICLPRSPCRIFVCSRWLCSSEPENS